MRPLHCCLGLGYFFVWTFLGAAALPAGIVLAAVEMARPALAQAVPVTAAIVVVLAGALQFTPWKAHRLACCREALVAYGLVATDVPAAWRLGLRLGMHCGLSCANLTAIMLVMGIMNL